MVKPTEQFTLTKKLHCKKQDAPLEVDDVAQFEIELYNSGLIPVSGLIADLIPDYFGVEWSDSQGGAGTGNDIAEEVSVDPGEVYSLTIFATVLEVDPCKGKTFRNVVTFTTDDECPRRFKALAPVCIIGCGPLKFDPRVQAINADRVLAMLTEWDEAQMAQFVDSYNCGNVYLPGGPNDPGFKEVVMECIQSIGKEAFISLLQQGV